jgi:hypothetical protein
MGLQIPNPSEPFQREGRVSEVWFKYLDELTRALNAANSSIGGINLSTLADAVEDTEGSLLVRGASAWEGLVPGSDGEALVIDGGVPAWATPATAVTHIAAGSVSAAATLDLALSSAYDEFEISLMNFVPATNADELLLRFSQNAGSSYLAGASDYDYAVNMITGLAINDTAFSAIVAASNVSNVSGNAGLTMTFRVFRPAASSFTKRVTFWGTAFANSDIDGLVGGGRLIANTNAIDHIRFLFSTGNITSGFYSVRGYKY